MLVEIKSNRPLSDEVFERMERLFESRRQRAVEARQRASQKAQERKSDLRQRDSGTPELRRRRGTLRQLRKRRSDFTDRHYAAALAIEAIWEATSRVSFSSMPSPEFERVDCDRPDSYDWPKFAAGAYNRRYLAWLSDINIIGRSRAEDWPDIVISAIVDGASCRELAKRHEINKNRIADIIVKTLDMYLQRGV